MKSPSRARYILKPLLAGLAIVVLSWLLLRAYLPDKPQQDSSASELKQSEAPNPGAGSAMLSLAKSEPKPLTFSSDLPETTEALLSEAHGMVDHMVSRYADNPDAYEMKARLHLTQGDTSEAAKSWQRCLALNANYGHAYEGLGSVAAKQGQYQEAVSNYRQALRLAPDSSRTQTELARSLIETGELEEAIALLDRSIKTDQRDAEKFVLLGRAWAQKQDHEKAKQSFEAAVKRNPRHANAWWGLGTACNRLGLHDEARKHLEEFQKLRAGERNVRQVERGGYDDLGALRQDIADIYTNSGRIYVMHDGGGDAERLWKRAAALHPTDANSRQALAWYYLQQKKPQDTIEMLEELSRLDPLNLTYKLEIARLHVSMNQVAVAEKLLQELCAAWPDEPLVLSALAELYLRSNQKPAETLALCRKVVELHPTAAHYVNLAAALERNNDLPNAIQMLSVAVEKDPGNPQYRQIYESFKRKTENRNGP